MILPFYRARGGSTSVRHAELVIAQTARYNVAMRKAQPISFRPSAGLGARLSALARRTGRPKAALIESLADEAERWRRYPGLGFRGPDWSRQAWLMGTGLDVWQVVRALQDFGGDAERMARESDLSLPQIQLAVAYHTEFPEEIDQAIEVDRTPLAQLKRDYPFIRSFD